MQHIDPKEHVLNNETLTIPDNALFRIKGFTFEGSLEKLDLSICHVTIQHLENIVEYINENNVSITSFVFPPNDYYVNFETQTLFGLLNNFEELDFTAVCSSKMEFLIQNLANAIEKDGFKRLKKLILPRGIWYDLPTNKIEDQTEILQKLLQRVDVLDLGQCVLESYQPVLNNICNSLKPNQKIVIWTSGTLPQSVNNSDSIVYETLHPDTSSENDVLYNHWERKMKEDTPSHSIPKFDEYEEENQKYWDLDKLHSCSDYGKGVKVAVLDSGFNAIHQREEDRFSRMDIKKYCSFVPKEYAQMDYCGHGTHCTGLIADSKVGIARKVEIYVGKVLSDQNEIEEEWLAEGIRWATNENVDIISISVGIETCHHHLLFQAINRAILNGIIVISSSCNYGRINQRNILFPGKLGNVICIGGHDHFAQPLPLSSVGREVDFLALGEDLWSLGGIGDYTYVKDRGTSQAAPQVAGLVALILGYDRKKRGLIKNVSDVRHILKEMSVSPGHHNEVRGYGAIDPGKIFNDRLKEETIEDLFYSYLPKNEQLENVENVEPKRRVKAFAQLKIKKTLVNNMLLQISGVEVQVKLMLDKGSAQIGETIEAILTIRAPIEDICKVLSIENLIFLDFGEDQVASGNFIEQLSPGSRTKRSTKSTTNVRQMKCQKR
eukprot:TRINITY_DN1196_c0_g1_i1.p1 TRINITY_DN1196_c0_g1~~TRINITY_DN1196_c0_g1_i1.p1  ORF type:complete len:664 (+),score=98.36 TRINITY_DN1196_c0_g1_i1:72-2063(+)